MQQVTELLGEVSELQFRPHVNTRSCPSCTDKDKRENCVSDGRYCFIRPKEAQKDEHGVFITRSIEAERQSDVLMDTLNFACQLNEPTFKEFSAHLRNFSSECAEVLSF
jgi:hypothetical protein